MDLMDYRRKIIANSPHLSSASGAVASFSDGADLPLKSLNVDIEPVQDLHGYENPWPGGGGKNLFDNQFSDRTINGLTWVLNSDGTITVNGTATAETQLHTQFVSGIEGECYFSGCPSGGSSTSYDVFIWDVTNSSRAKKWDRTTTVDSELGGGNAQVYLEEGVTYRFCYRIRNGYTANNVLFSPMIRLASVTDGTYAPYENICPIIGRDGVKVTRCGKNLLQCPTSGGRTNSGITWTYNSDGSVTASGTATGNSWSYGVPPATVTLPQGTYTASVTSPFGLVVQNLTDGGYFYNGGNSQVTFTLDKLTELGVHARVANGTTIDATTGIQIELGSTATPYEPYNGVTIWYAENALKPSPAFTETQNGLTFTSDGKGTYRVTGTNTATETVRSAILPVPSFTIPPSTTHTFYLNNNAINSNVFLSFMIGSTSIDSWAFNALNRTAPNYGTMGNKLCDGIRIVVAAGQTVDITFSPMLLPKENTDAYIIGRKNLFSNFEEGDKTDSGITFDFSDSDVVKISGTSTAINASSQNKIIGGTNAPTPIEFIQGQTYTISLQGTVSVSKANDFRIFLRSNSNANLWYGDSTNGVWTVTPESTFVAERIMFRVKSNGTTVNVDAHLQIELDTVYGGTLNLLTGVMTVNKGCDTFDGSSDETWNILSSDKQRISFRGWLSNAKKETATPITDMMTNSIPLSTTSENAFNNGKITCRGTAYQSVYVYIFVPPSEFNTIEQLRAYLADQPWQVVYPLATPFEIQLTPHQIRSLYGSNTIFADTGNVALEYWAHP